MRIGMVAESGFLPHPQIAYRQFGPSKEGHTNILFKAFNNAFEQIINVATLLPTPLEEARLRLNAEHEFTQMGGGSGCS